jgi:hypothetical protein
MASVRMMTPRWGTVELRRSPLLPSSASASRRLSPIRNVAESSAAWGILQGDLSNTAVVPPKRAGYWAFVDHAQLYGTTQSLKQVAVIVLGWTK